MLNEDEEREKRIQALMLALAAEEERQLASARIRAAMKAARERREKELGK